jgi:membrane protein YdbS with pleckstrin-like domain
MFELFKALALRIAKVPPEPHAPAGSPGSIRTFRSAPNYWKYLLVTWGLRQLAGACAIFVFHSMISTWKAAAVGIVPGVLHGFEMVGVAAYLAQMPFSLAAARLNFEMRWYIVTDRSLRVREGVFGVREMTLTFANVQNIAIRQGPLQRLLGIADVVVQTAGGGGASSHHGHERGDRGGSMHTGTLRAVDNAEQVRDLILDRLRRLRDAGLGDPDDRQTQGLPAEPVHSADALRAAARELVETARALRT